jgi:hypothetical protein
MKHLQRILNAFVFYVVGLSIISLTLLLTIIISNFFEWFFTWRYLHQALWIMLIFVILYFTGWIGENI